MKYFKTKHQKDSAKITTLFTLILVLLLFVVGQDYKEQPDEYGVAINFSSASSSEQKVSQEKPQEVDENVDNEKIEEEVVEEEVVEEKVVEEETPEENVTEEALENEEKLREEAEEAENLRKELEAKKKAETEAKELEAQKTKELAEKKAKAKELAETEAKAKEAAEKAKALEEAKALADAKAKAESEAKAAAAAAKKEKEGIGETPFALIENAPIYPGCEGGDNEAKKKCMSDKIKKFITQKFDTDLASDLSGIQKINISFKINTAGNVVSISAKASNPKLEAEAKRVTSLLPKMKPGMQQGKAVVVSYGLPIRIKPED